MSLRTVRPLTSSRVASSVPLHMARDCSSPSRASNRPEVLYIRREFSYEKNETVLTQLTF